jgi:hypothetical protein
MMMALPAHILSVFGIDRIVSVVSCWVYLGLTIMLICGLNAVELGVALTGVKIYVFRGVLHTPEEIL